MIELINSIDTWPKAMVASVLIVAVTCAVISFWIAFTGSKFPWEK